MLRFFIRLLSLWFLIFTAAFGAYLLIFNQEPIHVRLQGIAEFKVVTAVAFLACYLLGVVTVSLHFVFDMFSKVFEIRKQGKRIKELERLLAHEEIRSGGPTVETAPGADIS